jgi:hypothetical protein
MPIRWSSQVGGIYGSADNYARLQRPLFGYERQLMGSPVMKRLFQ